MKKRFAMRLCFVFIAAFAVITLLVTAMVSTALTSDSVVNVSTSFNNVNIDNYRNTTAASESSTIAPIDNLIPSVEAGFITTDTGNFRTISDNSELKFTWRKAAAYTLSVHFGSASIGSGKDIYTVNKGERIVVTLLDNKSYLINGERIRKSTIEINVYGEYGGAASFGRATKVEELAIQTDKEVLLEGLSIADFEKENFECVFNDDNGATMAYSTTAHQCEIIMIDSNNDFIKIMLYFFEPIEEVPEQPEEPDPDMPTDPKPSEPEEEKPEQPEEPNQDDDDNDSELPTEPDPSDPNEENPHLPNEDDDETTSPELPEQPDKPNDPELPNEDDNSGETELPTDPELPVEPDTDTPTEPEPNEPEEEKPEQPEEPNQDDDDNNSELPNENEGNEDTDLPNEDDGEITPPTDEDDNADEGIPSTDIEFPPNQTPQDNLEITNNSNFVATNSGNYRTDAYNSVIEFSWRGKATYTFYVFQGDALIICGGKIINVAAGKAWIMEFGKNEVIIDGKSYNVDKIKIIANGVATFGQEPLATSVEILTNVEYKLDGYKLPRYVNDLPNYIVGENDNAITLLSDVERKIEIILIDCNGDYVMVVLNFVAPPVVEPDDSEKPPIEPEKPGESETPPQVDPPIEEEKPEVPEEKPPVDDDQDSNPPIPPQDSDDGVDPDNDDDNGNEDDPNAGEDDSEQPDDDNNDDGDKPDEGNDSEQPNEGENPDDQQPDEDKPQPPSDEDGEEPPSDDGDNTPPNLPDNPDVPGNNDFKPDIVDKVANDSGVDYVKVVIVVVVASAILLGSAILIAITIRRKKKKNAK